jgi:phosphotransferase system HPr-like phosphotransfer protein
VLAGGWVIWFTSYGKEIWYERFQSRWQGWLRDHNASGSEETRSAILVSGGRELLIKDADGSGWKGFMYPAELNGVADAVNWAAERWSKVAGLKVARAITYFYSSAEARSGMSAELSLLRSAVPAPVQQPQKTEDEGKLRLPMDDPGLVGGFVWSARYRENGDWDPETLYLSPIQGSGGGLGAEMPATAEVYSVYRIHEGHQVEGLAAGGWDNNNYSIEQPTDAGARMAVAAPMNSGGQRPVNQTMMALSVRDLGAVEILSGSQTKMGVDMAKGLAEVEKLLPVIAGQGTRTLYLYGVLSSGTMSEDIHTAPDGPAHAVFSRDGRVAVMESGYPKHRENIGGRSMDNSAGSMFSSYDLGAIHPGSLPKGADVAAKQAELEEQLKNLIRLAFKEYGISIYLDFIPWRAPDAVTAENYKSFYYRELSAPEQKEYDLLPPGDNAKRRTWISSILKKAGDFTAVRVPKADGTGETLIFTRRADIGIASEDQVVPNPFHPQTQRYWIENLKRFVDWGVAGVRVDLGWRILADWQYQYYNEMRGFLGRRGVKLEDWMRSAGINDLAAGETFEVWWERQKRLAMPWRQIISEVGAYSRMVNRKPFDFIIEVYQEAYSAEVKQLLALGVKRNYDDRFFKAIVDGVLNKKEGLLDAVRKAVEASPHGVIFLSNYDQNALMNLLEEAGAVDAKEGLQLIISVLGRLGVPVMIDGREFIEEHGQAVPMVGGGKRGKDDFHAYAWSKELDRRREDGWAAKAFAGAPWSELLQTLEQKLGKPVSPKDMWVPRNTSANNRYVPIFWRDPERGWFLMLADTHPSWGPEYNYGPGRIKIELTASELPASMDPDAFAANFDRAQSVLISGANVWRAGLSDWNSPTSTERTLDIDLDPNGFKSANLLIYLGPAKAVRESADPIKHIFVDTTIPGDREELLLSLLRDQHTSPEMASQALWMAIADPHENVRATAANVLAQWHLEYGGPAQTAETWTQSLLDPLAVREVLGAAQPGYDAKHGRRNGRYAVLHALKLLSWMSRGEWPSGGEGQSYADSVIERVRSQIKLDAQSWDAKKEVRVRRTVRAEIKATHPNRRSLKHPEFEWDRDLSLGSDQLNSILQILRAVVVRSEEVAAHYPDSRRDTFYWVLEAVHEIVPDVPGDIAADAVYRGALPAGARMAEAYGVVIAEDHLEDPVLATRFTKLDAERGLHARPSDAVSLMADYVNLAAQMAQKKVWLRVRRAPEALSTNSDEETSQGFADLNSVLSLLTLGVTDGTELALEIGGTLSQQEADSLADIFAQLLSDRVTLSRGLNSSPVAKNEYRDRIYHVFDPEGTPLDSPLKARAHLRWNRVDRFLAQVIEAHPADQRAHIAIERDDETLAVFQVWRDKKTVWYALKGQAGRLPVEKVGSELPSNLPVYTPMIDLDTDSDSDRRIMPDAAVSLDIALAGDLIHWAGAWLGVDLKDAPLRANVELDEDDLIRRIGYGRDREAAEDLRRRLKIIQTHIHDMGMGRLLFKGQTDAIAGAPTARLFHPSNAGYADEANPGTLKWSYLQEDSEILPVLSSAILSALILAAPEEGKVSYLAALSPLYQRLIGSSDPNDVLTPELIEAARSNPGLLKPIKPLTLRGYLDVAVYLQELGRQAARMAA